MQGKDYFEQEQPPIKRDFTQEKIDITQIKEEYFPPCIQSILKGIKQDGRKRALFILTNFFSSLNYPPEELRKVIMEWNKKNHEPLREGYIISQLNATIRNPRKLLPPNCDNGAYYKDLGVECNPNIHCQRLKNPLNYTLSKIRMMNKPKRTKKTTSPKK